MQLFVRSLHGETLTIDADGSGVVGSLKESIYVSRT
jgi:hypothetical protein